MQERKVRTCIINFYDTVWAQDNKTSTIQPLKAEHLRKGPSVIAPFIDVYTELGLACICMCYTFSLDEREIPRRRLSRP
jgi:hypothetical protein